jgi:hypothetical protein
MNRNHADAPSSNLANRANKGFCGSQGNDECVSGISKCCAAEQVPVCVCVQLGNKVSSVAITVLISGFYLLVEARPVK